MKLYMKPEDTKSRGTGFISVFLQTRPQSEGVLETEEILFSLTLESQKQGQESVVHGNSGLNLFPHSFLGKQLFFCIFC